MKIGLIWRLTSEYWLIFLLNSCNWSRVTQKFNLFCLYLFSNNMNLLMKTLLVFDFVTDGVVWKCQRLWHGNVRSQNMAITRFLHCWWVFNSYFSYFLTLNFRRTWCLKEPFFKLKWIIRTIKRIEEELPISG